MRRNSFSNALSAGKAHSSGLQVTMASMLVWRLHKLGPRNARILETSMTKFS
jgi:hypothetical protein